MFNIIKYINNIIKSRNLAKVLFPTEKWIHTESNIWVAKSRLSQKEKEPNKWEKSILESKLPVDYQPQEHSVFIHLLSDLKIEAVKAKIAGELKNRPNNGNFICFFDKSSELLNWTYQELRAIIGSVNN